MVVRNFTVIAYDIVKDRQRHKLSQYLLAYGVRANYSVFECMLTDRQFEQIKLKVSNLIDLQTDRVLFYRICKSCYLRSEQLGRSTELPDDMILMV